ncbi:lactate utilization protein B [Aquipuribacter nitratireducens]|uniref:Lactate utilization protein B n=1 Tax=Aquipuribacter nitratireducens TaxID=650104 RepID=A0ABW0GLW5_9MICO
MTTFLGMPAAPPPPASSGSHLRGTDSFPHAAARTLTDDQLRRNLAHATTTIRGKRARVVAEVPDWEELRLAGEALKADTMARLPELLEQLEAAVTARGGVVHWARDAEEANRIVVDLAGAALDRHPQAAREVVKVKSMATQETRLNDAFEAAGITAHETDLAELIVQLGHDEGSHILVPAIHRNRREIREIFLREMPDVDELFPEGLTDEPRVLAEAARLRLRRTFLRAKVAISGANFAVAETGTLSVVESEGNGRMCLTLPETLITVMGVEKLVPTWADLEVFLQLLPRSSTGERMNPYTSMWTGVTPGDGPQEFHLVLLDNGRSRVLADPRGRAALHCIRCSACLNVCPVYERTGGHAYGSVYPGPIGAVLSPQLTGVTDDASASLPFASSLCGACFDACPVRIDIPSILVHMRAQAVDAHARDVDHVAERAGMATVAWLFRDPRRLRLAQRLSRLAGLLARLQGHPRHLSWLPGPGRSWTRTRDLPVPRGSFRDWWEKEGRS